MNSKGRIKKVAIIEEGKETTAAINYSFKYRRTIRKSCVRVDGKYYPCQMKNNEDVFLAVTSDGKLVIINKFFSHAEILGTI